MKFNPFVTSDQNKNHKWHFNGPSHTWRKITSSSLSSEQREKCERMMKLRLSEDMTKASRLALLSRCTEEIRTHIEPVWGGKAKGRHNCPCGPPPQQRWGCCQAKAT
ncbi:60S ribosomal protein L26-like 1 [Lemmus lemmus]